jgi:8-oxo-dGTP pyrophosphatase MutT (NUDIX family)
MNNEKMQRIYPYNCLSERLSGRDCEALPDTDGRTRASVALILRQLSDDMEILFIQRAAHENDPWSGHIAFPGGKWEPDELVCQTAHRETLEEIGIDLEDALYLGRLSDIVGANLPVWVSCCVYGMGQGEQSPVLSDEVSDVFWIRLSDVRDRSRHILAPVAFGKKLFEVPAIKLPGEGRPVLWGITYRLLMQFLEVLDTLDPDIAKNELYCTLPMSVELNEEDLS